jgi:hypothetical protein
VQPRVLAAIANLAEAGNFEVDEESYASIGVEPEFVGKDAAVLAILAHEACHHILMQSALEVDEPSLDETTTDDDGGER